MRSQEVYWAADGHTINKECASLLQNFQQSHSLFMEKDTDKCAAGAKLACDCGQQSKSSHRIARFSGQSHIWNIATACWLLWLVVGGSFDI